MENMFNILEVTTLMFEAKEESKHSHLLEGFNFAEVSELWSKR